MSDKVIITDGLENEPDFEYEDTSNNEGPKMAGVTYLNAALFEEDEEEVEEEVVEDVALIPEASTLAKLQKDNEELRVQLGTIAQQLNNTSTLQESINSLGNRMQPAPTQKPRESDADYHARLREHFFEDVPKHLEEYNQRVNGPFIQQMVTQNLKLQKGLLKLDPQKGNLFQKYEKEIDKEFENLPPAQRYSDPEIYVKLYNIVVSQHVDEIIEEREKERSNDGGNNTITTTTTPNKPKGNYAASTTTKPITKGKQRAKITLNNVPDYVKQIAHSRGVNPVDCYLWMKENNQLRKGN